MTNDNHTSILTSEELEFLRLLNRIDEQDRALVRKILIDLIKEVPNGQ